MRDRKKERKSTRDILVSLANIKYADMTPKQQEKFITALAQLLDVMDETGKVKAVA